MLFKQFIVLMCAFSLQLGATEGVVLLHGLCRSASSMDKLGAFLGDQGYVVVNQGYPSTKGSVAKLADDCLSAVLADARLAGCTRIHFVTHSMGGILVRSYFGKHVDARLGRVVMLGPPNQGSEVVDALSGWRVFNWINGPAGAELGTTDSSTPRKLGPVHFELGVIAGDRSINWINSLLWINGDDDGKVSVENTKVEGMKDHLVLHVTHPLMMKSPEVMRQCLAFLSSGAFAH